MATTINQITLETRSICSSLVTERYTASSADKLLASSDVSH